MSTNSSTVSASKTNGASGPPPYVVISISAKTLPTKKPFKTALHEPNAKNGEKSQWNTYLYIFSCTDASGAPVWKVGQTYDDNTYGSMKRYGPWLAYRGIFQILHHGHALELLVRRYVAQIAGPSIDDSEWFANAGSAIKALKTAIDSNDTYKAESPRRMLNVTEFAHAYTCGHGGKLDDYLSLFRLEYRGKLYVLCEKNLNQSLKVIASSEYEQNSVTGAVALVKDIPIAPDPVPTEAPHDKPESDSSD